MRPCFSALQPSQPVFVVSLCRPQKDLSKLTEGSLNLADFNYFSLKINSSAEKTPSCWGSQSVMKSQSMRHTREEFRLRAKLFSLMLGGFSPSNHIEMIEMWCRNPIGKKICEREGKTTSILLRPGFSPVVFLLARGECCTADLCPLRSGFLRSAAARIFQLFPGRVETINSQMEPHPDGMSLGLRKTEFLCRWGHFPIGSGGLPGILLLIPTGQTRVILTSTHFRGDFDDRKRGRVVVYISQSAVVNLVIKLIFVIFGSDAHFSIEYPVMLSENTIFATIRLVCACIPPTRRAIAVKMGLIAPLHMAQMT